MPPRRAAKPPKTAPERTTDRPMIHDVPPQQEQPPAITPSTTRSQFVRNFLRRLVILLFAAAATYLSLLVKDDPLKAFVKSGDLVSRRSFEVPCSDDYGKTFPECVPRRCGRVVMDGLLAADDVERLLTIAKEGFKLARLDSGRSTLDLHTGILRSTSGTSVNIYKLPTAKKIFTKKDFAALARVRSTIQLRITLEFGANPNMVFQTHPLVITRITPEQAAPGGSGYWHPHVHKDAHGAWYYSSVVDLGTYDKDFSGGRFVLVDKDINRTVEPRKGRLSLFTSGSENLQYVERVRMGERYFVTVAFTCEPSSAMPDPSLQNLKITS